MHAGTRLRTKTHQIAVRLPDALFAKLQTRAGSFDVTLAECARRVLETSLTVTNDEGNLPLLTAISAEVQRLTFLAAQDGHDVSSEEIKKIIEDQAVANAPAVVRRWIWKVGQLNG